MTTSCTTLLSPSTTDINARPSLLRDTNTPSPNMDLWNATLGNRFLVWVSIFNSGSGMNPNSPNSAISLRGNNEQNRLKIHIHNIRNYFFKYLFYNTLKSRYDIKLRSKLWRRHLCTWLMQLSSGVRRSDHVSNIITIKFQPTVQVYKTPTNVSNKKNNYND